MTNITKLPDGHYFVFGSNEAGRHGKGIRYSDTSRAPCEREDLVFNVDTLCVDGWKKED